MIPREWYRKLSMSGVNVRSSASVEVAPSSWNSAQLPRANPPPNSRSRSGTPLE
jgi:hypothetical protein